MRALLAILFSLTAWSTPTRAQVAVIAHPSVPVETIDRSELLDFYMGDVQRWDNDVRVVVFDLKASSSVKEAFYGYLGRSSARMKSIWLKRKLSGEGDPPESVETEEEMLKRVASTPGAVGFVRKNSVRGTVKVLAEIDESEV